VTVSRPVSGECFTSALTCGFVYSYVATIFRAAVNDGRISVTPCREINLPEVPVNQVVPMPSARFA
jgi:hypothetical protein